MIRLTSDTPEFPWHAAPVCYIVVAAEGVRQVRYIDDKRAAARAAIDGKIDLFVVWPGQWRSDLFQVDNPEAMAKAVGA